MVPSLATAGGGAEAPVGELPPAESNEYADAASWPAGAGAEPLTGKGSGLTAAGDGAPQADFTG